MSTTPLPPCGYRPEDLGRPPQTLADIIRGAQIRAGEQLVVDITEVPARSMHAALDLMLAPEVPRFDRNLGRAAFYAPCVATRLRVIRAFPEVFKPYLDKVMERELTAGA